MFCTHCGCKRGSGSFCTNCGARLVPTVPPIVEQSSTEFKGTFSSEPVSHCPHLASRPDAARQAVLGLFQRWGLIASLGVV
jgi:hypothetical protein